MIKMMQLEEKEDYKIHGMCHNYLNFVNCWKEYSREKQKYIRT
jgi:hypothetical protein